MVSSRRKQLLSMALKELIRRSFAMLVFGALAMRCCYLGCSVSTFRWNLPPPPKSSALADRLDQLERPQALMALAADHEMIVEQDAELLRRGGHRLGHGHVIAR